MSSGNTKEDGLNFGVDIQKYLSNEFNIEISSTGHVCRFDPISKHDSFLPSYKPHLDMSLIIITTSVVAYKHVVYATKILKIPLLSLQAYFFN